MSIKKKTTKYGDEEFSIFLRKSFASSMGYNSKELDKPIIGIINTYSGFNNCHRLVPDLIRAVKDGISEKGGIGIEFPTISLGEPFIFPTSMAYRNLMSIDVEEMLKAHPISSCVMVGGCDKTVPAQLMGAVSANIPVIQLVVGPMLALSYKGETIGACTDCRRFWSEFRSGKINEREIVGLQDNLAPTAGTCAVMGTASTMACISEILGFSLPNSSTAPAVHSERLRIAKSTGRMAFDLIKNKRILPKDLVTKNSIENALRVIMAVGGSTNAIIHLSAIAGRAGINFNGDLLNKISDETPTLLNLKPVGEHYMQDFFAAGGMYALMYELRDCLHLDCKNIHGMTLKKFLKHKPNYVDRNVIRTIKNPFQKKGAIISISGNIAQNGAILKRGAANESLFERTGRAIVFNSLEDLSHRIDSDDLDVNENDFLILKNSGPFSKECMPEAGFIPIPKKLSKKGVRDMVRISDARMSGTAYGTVILHVSPDSASGGNFAYVQNGDRIKLSVKKRQINLLINKEEFKKRKLNKPIKPEESRGYMKLYFDHITQAEKGCDFDFLIG